MDWENFLLLAAHIHFMSSVAGDHYECLHAISLALQEKKKMQDPEWVNSLFFHSLSLFSFFLNPERVDKGPIK